MAIKKSLPQESKPDSKKRKKTNRFGAGVVEKKIRDASGKVVKTYRYVRVRYEGDDGKMHSKQSPYAGNATHASEIRKQLKGTLESHGEKALAHWNDTFNDLADYYEEKYLIPAKYVDGKKVQGRRNLAVPKSQLRSLRRILGARKNRTITYETVRDVRMQMLNTPTRSTESEPDGHQRSVIDVDRRMQLLRHILKVGRRGSWLLHDPFADAEEALITPSDEKKRRRVMSFEEEKALLIHCVDTWGETKDGRPYKILSRSHVRIFIVGLVDTLMRPGEFLKLRDVDANFDLRKTTVQQMNTKTLSERAAPISVRFAKELRAWLDLHPPQPGGRIFDFKGIKRVWDEVKKAAGVTDLRLRDLRRTGATRLMRAGYPIPEISRLLGHTTLEMTYEYIGTDVDTTGRAADILDAMHEEREKKETVH